MALIRGMTMADYDRVIALLQTTPGVTFRDADSPQATARYLERNPGLSFVAERDGAIVGCIMCGHDGRRGYLQHLAVHPAHRQQGIAAALARRCLAQLESLGIFKSHLDVFKTNEAGQAFWQSQGWKLRTDILRYSFTSNGRANA